MQNKISKSFIIIPKMQPILSKDSANFAEYTICEDKNRKSTLAVPRNTLAKANEKRDWRIYISLKVTHFLA